MEATFSTDHRARRLIEELTDALCLLYECRRRGATDVDRLLEYIEYTMDEIERCRLGTSAELFATMVSAQANGEVLC